MGKWRKTEIIVPIILTSIFLFGTIISTFWIDAKFETTHLEIQKELNELEHDNNELQKDIRDLKIEQNDLARALRLPIKSIDMEYGEAFFQTRLVTLH